jgi:hypothetical protein
MGMTVPGFPGAGIECATCEPDRATRTTRPVSGTVAPGGRRTRLARHVCSALLTELSAQVVEVEKDLKDQLDRDGAAQVLRERRRFIRGD